MYFLKRLLYMVLVIFGVSVIMFGLVRVIPGDPIAKALGPGADAAAIKKMRDQMGLDRPIHVQYFRYIEGITRGELGMSLVEYRDVAEIIKDKLPATLELILASMAMAVIAGIPLGVMSALKRNSLTDHFNTLISLFGVSFPQFWVGIMIQLFFGYILGFLPITGRISGSPPTSITRFFLLDSLLTLNFPAFWDSLLHLAAPAFVLSLSPLANITRLIRANMIDEMSKDYINVSKATGMPQAIISFKYMLRNAFSPAMTMIGFMIPLQMGTAFVVEQVFAWPGIARFGADAITTNDFNGAVGVTLVISVAVVVTNFIVDELYGVLDPRIKLRR